MRAPPTCSIVASCSSRGVLVPDIASDAFVAWVADEIAPIARAHGFTGKGPVFRMHDGPVWTVFALERRRKDPWEERT